MCVCTTVGNVIEYDIRRDLKSCRNLFYTIRSKGPFRIYVNDLPIAATIGVWELSRHTEGVSQLSLSARKK